MMHGLLVYSLERISSLQHFYLLEKENIDKVSADGMRTNCFGYLADRYFSALTRVDDNSGEVERLKKQLENYLDVIETNSDSGSIVYRLKRADYLKEQGYEIDIKKASLMYRQFADMPIIHGSNTLIMLITRFEEFISNFLVELFKMFPQKYLDNQSVTFSELSSSNIKDVRDLIISRQLDATMRDSFKVWFKIFESHKLSFEHYSDEMKILEEIYARRNVIVHNSGCVNESYLGMVKDSKHNIGDVLTVDTAYLASAFDAINVLIFAIMIEAAKLVKTDKNEYLQSIFCVIFESLCAGKYRLCMKVYNALLNSKSLDALHKTMSTINYWISCKEINGLDSVKTEIRRYDVSALAPIFELAKYLLLEEYELVVVVLEQLYSKNDVNANMIDTWPLFKNFRDTTQYEAFKVAHADDFKVATFEFAAENTSAVDESDVLEKVESTCDCLSEEQQIDDAEKEALLV